jgi:hypothetical protein
LHERWTLAPPHVAAHMYAYPPIPLDVIPRNEHVTRCASSSPSSPAAAAQKQMTPSAPSLFATTPTPL